MAANASINLGIFQTPNLDQAQRDALLKGLQKALDGASVTVSIRYHKVTKSKPRIEGEDYSSPLPPEFLIGQVKKVAVGKRGPYILLDATLTRDPNVAQDATSVADAAAETGNKIGWTSIKGEGVEQVLKVTTVEQTAPATAQ